MSSLSVKLSMPTRVQPEVFPKPGKAGVYTNKMHYFKKHILDELAKKKFAIDFMDPVDTDELQVPQYYTVINRPMDVGTIIKRVENNYYRDVDEAISDFRQVINNCYNFNRPDNVVYRKGIQLEKFFQRAIKNIPKGPPVPCNKDPQATSKLPKANPLPGALEQECRNQLRKLQTVTNNAEATSRNFFAPKWNSFSAKLDKQFFKTLDEFRSQVDGMFQKYYEQATGIYEQVYGESSASKFNNFIATFASTFSTHINQFLKEAKGMDLACQLAQNNIIKCVKEPQKAISLAETFGATVAQFQVSLKGHVSAISALGSENYEEIPTATVEAQEIPAGLYLPTEGLEFLVDTPDAGLSEADPKLEPIDQEERRQIQALFSTLPARAMREICGIVHSNEKLGRDSNGGLTFDLNTFELANVQIMKAAVTRALKLNNKINLRSKQKQEEENMRSNLESQLSDISKRLGQSSRKKPAPSTGEKKNGKRGGSSRRGQKRAPSPSTQAEAVTAATGPTKRMALPKPFIPSTPEKLASKASRKSQAVPGTPRSLKSTFPLTPGGRVVRKPVTPRTPSTPLRRTVVCRRTPIAGNASKGGRGRYKAPAVVPKPTTKPKEVKKYKTLADTSTEEEDNNDMEAPSTSKNPPSQKGKKSKAKKGQKQKNQKGQKKSNQKKGQLCLTPGNVLNEDLSLSSSSSDED